MDDEFRMRPGDLSSFLREREEIAASAHYVQARFLQVYQILWKARIGELTPRWRDDLTTGTDAAADQLIVHELACMPTRPWEPFVAGGDWRTALDTWYSDLLSADDYLVQHEIRPASAKHPNPHTQYSRLTEVLRESQAIQQGEQALDDARDRLRLLWGASYRAGLSAGGEESDWRGWYRTRTQRLRQPSGERVPRHDDDASIPFLEHLPNYWTAGTESSGPLIS